MADFSVQITNFQNYGIYNYQFDEAGNEILNPSSSVFQQHYIAFPTVNFAYDNDKILSFYDPTFTEFTPPPSEESSAPTQQDTLNQLNEMVKQNQLLQNQLDVLVSQNEFSPTDADTQATKDIILALRIQMGQGTSAADFYNEFPYLPVPLEKKDITEV